MKVLQITPTFLPNIGGIEYFVHNLSRNLISNNIHCDILVVSPFYRVNDAIRITNYEPNYGVYFNEIEGINVYTLTYKNLIELIMRSKKTISLINKYDIIHLHDPHLAILTLIFTILTKSRAKKILSTHGFFFHTPNLKMLKKIYWSVIAKRVLRNYDMIIAVSQSDMEKLNMCKLKGVKIKLIENPVNIDRFSSLDNLINFNDCSFVFWGRISNNKQIDKFIEVIAYLRYNKMVNCTFTIVGPVFDREYFRFLKNMAKTLNIEKNINFVGEVDEEKFSRIISTPPYFVMPSYYEGFGLSLVEAMAAGKIVIANDIPVFRKIILHSSNGFLIDFSDSYKAGESIYEIIKLDFKYKKDISKKAVETAEKYSWKKNIKKFIDAYSELML